MEINLKDTSLRRALSCLNKRPKTTKKQKPTKKAKVARTDEENAKK